jgi:hypothetical protein
MQGCKEFFIRASNLKAGGYIARFPYRKLMKGVHGLHCLQYQKVILHYVLHSLLQSFTLPVLRWYPLTEPLTFSKGFPLSLPLR